MELMKMFGSLLLITLVLGHFLFIAFFLFPTNQLLYLALKNNSDFLLASEIPQDVEIFLSDNHIKINSNFSLIDNHKSKFIIKILSLKKLYFMDSSESLAFDMNLFVYNHHIVGIKSFAHIFYDKPLFQLSNKEWINLVNLQSIFQRK